MSNLYSIIKIDNSDEIIKINTIVNSRIKNTRIKINPTGQVELVIRRESDFDKAFKFACEKKKWILKKLKELTKITNYQSKIPIFGVEHELIKNCNNLNNLVEIINQKIYISELCNKNNLNIIIKLQLVKLLKKKIELYCQEYAVKLNVSYKKISIKDTKTRWGSCSSEGNLSFCWRLVFAPHYVVEYLVVHEVCHLIEMNHSSKFWNLVHFLLPNYSLGNVWLKKNGKVLHQILL